MKRLAFIALAATLGSLPGFHAPVADAAAPGSLPGFRALSADAHAPFAPASGFKPLRFDVALDEGVPVVEWAAESEDGLDRYEIEVSAESGDRIRVIEVAPRGANHPYAFRDEDLYKSAELVTYSLYAVLDDGAREQVGEMQIAYTPTAVRRTWGSIKAMFQ